MYPIEEVPATPPAPPVEPVPGEPPISWLTILQLAGSLIAAFVLFSLSAFMAIQGVSNLSGQASSSAATPYFIFAAGLALCCVLVLPSCYFALLRLLNRPSPNFLKRSPSFWGVLIGVSVILVLPVSLVVGGAASRFPAVSWLVLPFMHLLATGIPILFFVSIGLRGLQIGSPQRLWGLFGAGLALGPLLILIAESLMLIAGIILAVFYVASQPSLRAELTVLLTRIRLGSPSQQELVNILQPYLTSPIVVYSLFAVLAFLTPLIEEILKPIGMVFLIGRSFTPAQGFTAGVLSGAGYALSESIFRFGSDRDWLAIVIARTGTGAIHILATGLVGLGLAYAWGRSNYLRLGILMVSAMGVHGLWNALSLLSSSVAFQPSGQAGVSSLARFIENASPYGLIAEALVCVGLIGWINFKLKTIGELHGLDTTTGTNLPSSG